MRLAALLHDSDDKKYFKDTQNAIEISSEALEDFPAKQQIIEEVKEMISYVSASDNGNSIPDRAKTSPELLWVRFSDRLEAIGMIGAVRCYQYNEEKGRD